MFGFNHRQLTRVLVLGLGLASAGCGSGSDVVAACNGAFEKLTSCAGPLPPAQKAAVEAQAASFKAQCDVQGNSSVCASERTAFYNCYKNVACTVFTSGGADVCTAETAALSSCGGS